MYRKWSFYQIILYKFIPDLSIFLREHIFLTEIFVISKFEPELFDLFQRRWRIFLIEWPILQFNVQILSGISRFLDKNWHIYHLKCSIFQINAYIWSGIGRDFARN